MTWRFAGRTQAQFVQRSRVFRIESRRWFLPGSPLRIFHKLRLQSSETVPRNLTAEDSLCNAWERQSPDWRIAKRHSGKWRSRGEPAPLLSGQARSGRYQNKIASVGEQFANGCNQIATLWKDFILEVRLIGAKGVHRGNAPHGSVQVIKKLVRDARGDFGAVTP